jgi:hypothetical protein
MLILLPDAYKASSPYVGLLKQSILIVVLNLCLTPYNNSCEIKTLRKQEHLHITRLEMDNVSVSRGLSAS